MPANIQFSAVIPSYNRDRTLGRAIDSVLAQEYRAAEILVIDDGSNDGTAELVARYGQSVRYFYQPNSGVSAARNRGVKESQHDWIAFLDSDDYWLPQHLKRMAHAIEATNGQAGVYFSDVKRPLDEGGNSLWELCQFEIASPFEFMSEAEDWVLKKIQPMMLQASVLRREKYWECGALPSALRTREDTLLFLKMGLLFPVCAVSGCGTAMMADGGMRLTKEIDCTTVDYALATIFFLKEVLALKQLISAQRRKHLKAKLSDAYFGAGRAFYRQKKHLTAAWYLLQSACVSRTVFARCLLRSSRQRVITPLRAISSTS